MTWAKVFAVLLCLCALNKGHGFGALNKGLPLLMIGALNKGLVNAMVAESGGGQPPDGGGDKNPPGGGGDQEWEDWEWEDWQEWKRSKKIWYWDNKKEGWNWRWMSGSLQERLRREQLLKGPCTTEEERVLRLAAMGRSRLRRIGWVSRNSFQSFPPRCFKEFLGGKASHWFLFLCPLCRRQRRKIQEKGGGKMGGGQESHGRALAEVGRSPASRPATANATADLVVVAAATTAPAAVLDCTVPPAAAAANRTVWGGGLACMKYSLPCTRARVALHKGYFFPYKCMLCIFSMFPLKMLACRTSGQCLVLATPKCRPRRASSEGTIFSTMYVLQCWCFISSCHAFHFFAGGASAAASSGDGQGPGPSPAQGPGLEQGQDSTSESEEEPLEHEEEEKDDKDKMEEVKVEEDPVPSEESEWESFEEEEEEEGVNETPQLPGTGVVEEPEVEEVPVLPKDTHCLNSKAKAKPPQRENPVDEQEEGDRKTVEAQKKKRRKRQRKKKGPSNERPWDWDKQAHWRRRRRRPQWIPGFHCLEQGPG